MDGIGYTMKGFIHYAIMSYKYHVADDQGYANSVSSYTVRLFVDHSNVDLSLCNDVTNSIPLGVKH